ncbi:hypothetical protein LK09_07980 [Microbacterium mangrovi]|uniref:Xaa-Pro dipeptidyl-peptidase C-terminal domain-containing protein n=1 Tax=Microbacterium mangrovi TaxID=1348253 RepID=A0A0B2AAP7_9MICO|nr:CocE/NonD family hydrolase [Microbacterium mangrovi]KHK98813.1 hypothetical protein LK09_07980 [Microbacterium mangrovi]
MGFTIIEKISAEEPSERSIEYAVPTRDGFQLATDVYLPEKATAHSAVLVRTPYDKRSFYTGLKFEAEYFTSRGFVFIAQDVRGKYGSTGQTIPYAFDVADAYDTAEWVVKQPWSNGKIGVMGASYYGFTTWAAVASGHPAIQAAIPMVTGVDMGNGHVGGRWRQEVQSFASLNDLLQIWTTNEGYLADIDWSSGSVEEIIAEAREQIGRCVGAEEKLARTKTEDWYSPYGNRHPYHTTQIPVLHWQNWYDPGLAPDGMRDWRHFSSLPGWSNLHYLRVGSADHGGYKLEDVGRGDEANPYLNEAALDAKIQEETAEHADFFDEHLNGRLPLKPRPRAKWHVGHVGWQESDQYPPDATITQFVLSADPSGLHTLGSQAAAPEDLSWTHDPANPVPSSVDMEALWYFVAAYPDERDYVDRADVLTFRTAPLAKNLDFAGQPVLTATVDFEGPTTHVHVRLQDVAPDGTTRRITQGRVALARAIGGSFRLPLDDNAYRVRAGHSLQLQIASSDYPHYAVHPGTGDNLYDIEATAKTVQTLRLGGVSARLEMPTIDLA